MFEPVSESSQAASMLRSLGLVVEGGRIRSVNFDVAKDCYVHHSRVPVALVGYAMLLPSFAQSKFPKFTFIDLIQKRPQMDGIEATALAAVCGVQAGPLTWDGAAVHFGKVLWEVIEKYKLQTFFARMPEDRRFGSQGDHYLMRPLGFDWNSPGEPELPEVLAKWRADYRKLPTEMQLMVATILQLYRQGDDRWWMVRVPKRWHAAEGITALHSRGMLDDWARLYVAYAGW